MATKSLVALIDSGRAGPRFLQQAERWLRPPALAPDGDLDAPIWFPAREFSAWIGRALEERLAEWPEWEKAEPIALGSWGRGELCPASDLDLLFAGDEGAAAAVTARLQEAGAKVRARVPEDAEDWAKGVEPFDVLALFQARPFAGSAAGKLRAQQARLRRQGAARAKALLSAMAKERSAREKRYDSIASFLEPNLKYGHGGLRDLEQAISVGRVHPEKFPRNLHAVRVLGYYKSFFLTCRQKLHLSGAPGDVLTAPEQASLAHWFGYPDARAFMRQFERGLARVSFYADWIFAFATAPPARIRAAEAKPLRRPIDLFKAFEADPSILMQARARARLESAFGPPPSADRPHPTPLSPAQWKEIGSAMRRLLSPATAEGPAIALFRSRLIDRAVPEFSRIVGHVQHDQYHRFSVDAHLLQAVREAKRARAKPSAAGRLAPALKRLDRAGWEALGWASLFHDLGKGGEADHSVAGASLARKTLARFGIGNAMADDVAWLVENHLLLSEAAFRRNPRSPETWRSLAEAGVVGRRLDLLAVFTYLDIRATNPEAWTSWKERLMADLLEALRSPAAGATVEFLAEAKAKGLEGSTLVQGLDPSLTELLPRKALLEDLARASEASGDLPPLAVRTRRQEVWVRLHARQDRPGLFMEFVERLRAAGLGVRHAAVQTDPVIGAYDWFMVKTGKAPKAIERALASAAAGSTLGARGGGSEAVGFDQVDLVAESPTEWTFSFRGRDHLGALTGAARALFQANLQIRWARVHTWGRQIDDVFGVAPASRASAQDVESELRRALVEPARVR